MKRLSLILTALILVTGCTKDIEYRGTDRGPIMVANSMNRAGDKAYVRVTRSRYFLDSGNPDYTLSDAAVIMTIGGSYHELNYDSRNRNYTSDCTVKPGSILQISAAHPDFGQVYACDTVPKAFSCTVDTAYQAFSMKGIAIDTMFYHGLDVGMIDSVCSFDFCLSSDTGRNEYFMIEFEPIRRFISIRGDTLDTICQYLSYRIATPTLYAIEMIDNESIGDFSELMDLLPVISNGINSFTFSDRHLSDTTHLVFELLMTPVDSTLHIIKSDIKAKYAIRSLSWAAYTYQMAARNFGNHNSPMSEPVTMWTNIQGDGTGVLGSYVEISDSLSLREF